MLRRMDVPTVLHETLVSKFRYFDFPHTNRIKIQFTARAHSSLPKKHSFFPLRLIEIAFRDRLMLSASALEFHRLLKCAARKI